MENTLTEKLISVLLVTDCVTKRKPTIGSVCLLMSIVPCKEIDLAGQTSQRCNEHTIESKIVFFVDLQKQVTTFMEQEQNH